MKGDIHPKVGAGMFAGALVAFVLAIIKLKFGVDLSGQEANLVILVTAGVGYWMPSETTETQPVLPKKE